jgi:hypothetical protein
VTDNPSNLGNYVTADSQTTVSTLLRGTAWRKAKTEPTEQES